MACVAATITHPRPVILRGNRRSKLRHPRAVVGGWVGRTRARLLNLVEQARRPVLTLGSMAAGCHAAWQIWHPLGWLALMVAGLWLERITGPED